MNRLNAITFKQLRALSAVCEFGAISTAAEMLSLTPPAVHSQLRALEENFGCALVSRSAGGFAPTEEGEALLAAYRTARAALERAVHQIDTLSKGLSGTVVLGVVSTAKYYAPRLVALLQAEFPDIEVVLRIGNRARIIQMIETGDLDLVIMGRPPRQPSVTARSFGAHPHLLVAPPGHPLTRLDKVTPDDILAQHFVMREHGSGTRILTMRFLDEIGQGSEISYTEMESNETIKQAVAAGLGVAILSGHTVHEELKSGRLVSIPAERLPIIRHWFVLHGAGQALSQPAMRIMDWIVANPERFLPGGAGVAH